ncbi:Rap1a/Tai family immunity protein [Pseudomonas sp. FP1742]|uniref:Rap1a/Tai family immunity protein n=1 Tax=Pseudomonas sp. FP1742 TaxID=2954079 RepID=UPI00273280D9|nr:Rap1a/Tai family immunity protein [Pseudomonas sp. FP1742]WLG52246.1 Rap1a/Tai family immunity protein [Pseudomonas sp. FP1742]
MKAWTVAAGIALIGTLASGSAMALDGNGLLSACQMTIRFSDGDKNVSAADVGQCSGIVEGVEGAIFVLNDSVGPNMKTCYPPNGTTNIQKVRIVVKYMLEHPDQLHLPAAALTLISYMGAFPCKK